MTFDNYTITDVSLQVLFNVVLTYHSVIVLQMHRVNYLNDRVSWLETWRYKLEFRR